MSDSYAANGDLVELSVPASSAYLAVLRTTSAGLGARLGLTLDDIEDLRIAVDEACAILLPIAVPGANLHCRFALHPDALEVNVGVEAARAELPAEESFSWTVLSALAGEVSSSAGDGRVAITLRKKRE
ncbi:anti-sigma factor [Actinobacteria bacterium YIM 96077]|uniref:Anti-sigma factor n=1 Tax=Phytoactinopolyspora halophila TaxID=1981511 RepID=A0A329R283_9ACTN|nr:anti-sigma factor [Phytoactinopolyspora halophila]AYY12001.1 anti-sigma factor [Actinobacteria bacterium YIM 96077]RAW18764.1 anti-sigma factor [Phytoactinopolyspora halophila]